jgi:hypothetical protein
MQLTANDDQRRLLLEETSRADDVGARVLWRARRPWLYLKVRPWLYLKVLRLVCTTVRACFDENGDFFDENGWV